MNKSKKSSHVRTATLALAYIRERCFSDGSLIPENQEEAYLAYKRLWANADKFLDRAEANQEHRQQARKLWQFHREARYGPALSRSWKRMRTAGFLKCWKRLALLSQPAIHLQQLLGSRATEVEQYFPAQPVENASKFLKPILDAALRDDDQFWENLKIAAKFTPSALHIFLAEYSILFARRPPALTFVELHKILHWMDAANLRSKIRELRKKYGELAVPLKRGRRGRPRKK